MYRVALGYVPAAVWVFCCMLAVLPAADGSEPSGIELLRDREYLPGLLRLIGSARSSIHICMFQAVQYHDRKESPSNSILEKLVDARRRGIAIQVILDDGGSLQEVTKTNLQTAAFLKKAGIEVYLDSSAVTTHTKFLVFDSETALLGSTNWTYSALARNHELSAVIRSRATAIQMLQYFDSIRAAGKRF